jgi:DNA-binding PadR family transcriptional regulator
MHPLFARRFGYECTGRYGRRHGFGWRTDVPGGSDIGWHGFRSGRKLGAEDLQLLILALLEEKPAHGYEIIKALGERSGGFYEPSPGMVYPALTYLEEIGYASVAVAGNKKQYSITDAGREHLSRNRGTIDTILAQLQWVGEKMEHVRRAFAHESSEADERPQGPLFGRRRRQWMSAELHQAGLQLKAALFEKRHSDAQEQQRIADILKHAAQMIRGK